MDLNELRKKINEGGEYTRADLHEAIEQMRTVRVEAATKSTTKRLEKAGASDAELDKGLEDLGIKL